MTQDINDDTDENLLEPKTNRSPEEVGREIFRLLEQYEELRVTQGKSKYDVKIFANE